MVQFGEIMFMIYKEKAVTYVAGKASFMIAFRRPCLALGIHLLAFGDQHDFLLMSA